MAEATHASPLPLKRRGLRQAKAHYCHMAPSWFANNWQVDYTTLAVRHCIWIDDRRRARKKACNSNLRWAILCKRHVEPHRPPTTLLRGGFGPARDGDADAQRASAEKP
jgi:hypothetical protein